MLGSPRLPTKKDLAEVDQMAVQEKPHVLCLHRRRAWLSEDSQRPPGK